MITPTGRKRAPGAGRKPTGLTLEHVYLPKTLIADARAEQARRAPTKASIGGIIAEWAERGAKKESDAPSLCPSQPHSGVIKT